MATHSHSVGLCGPGRWCNRGRRGGDQEEESKSESKTSQVEVRVDKNANRDSGKKDSNEQVTVVLGVRGGQSDVVRDAIEKLEKQLKSSGLPEELQRKAIDSLRGQLENQATSPEGTKRAKWSSEQKSNSNVSNEKMPSEAPAKSDAKKGEQGAEWNKRFNDVQRRIQVQIPAFDRLPQGIPPQIVQSFGFHSPFAPAQRDKLRDAVSETLKDNRVEEEVIDKVIRRIDEVFKENASQFPFSTSVAKQPSYRIGVACRTREPGETESGLIVDSVFENGPASKAGILPGDRIVRVDEKEVQSLQDIIDAVQKAGEAKRAIAIETVRGEMRNELQVTPEAAAVAELDADRIRYMFFGQPPMSGQAWVMPQPYSPP